MSASANVLSIQALEDLKTALVRFRGEAQEVLNAANIEIQRTLDWLVQRQTYWQTEVRRRQEIVAQARAALARCQASGYRDQEGHYYPPNCSREEQVLAQATSYLEQATTELQTVQYWMRSTQQSAAEFQREAQRLNTWLNNDLSKAMAILNQKISILQSYVGMVAPAMDASSPIESTSAPTSNLSQVTWAEQRAILQRVDAGQPITIDELKRLQQTPSDLKTETRAEDESWIQQIIESERYREAMRDSNEAQDLRDALLAAMKAINYWRPR